LQRLGSDEKSWKISLLVCTKANVEETVHWSPQMLGLLGYRYYIILQNVMAAFFAVKFCASMQHIT